MHKEHENSKYYFTIIHGSYREELIDGSYFENGRPFVGHLLSIENIYWANWALKYTWAFPRETCMSYSPLYLFWQGNQSKVEGGLFAADDMSELAEIAMKLSYVKNKKTCTVEKEINRYYSRQKVLYSRKSHGKGFSYSKHSYCKNYSRNIQRMVEVSSEYNFQYAIDRDKARLNELLDCESKRTHNSWKRKKNRHQWQLHEK